MNTKNIRILGVLLGDIHTEPSARTKYGFLFEALGRSFSLFDIYDASLTGFDRLQNALMTISPRKQVWREKFYKNAFAYKLRSERIAERIRSCLPEIDLIFQVGTLFNAKYEHLPIPNVIYTDYTALLSAAIPSAGRSPFSRKGLKQWLVLEQQAYHSAAHICTRSQFVKNSIIRDYGIEPRQVTVVGGGVNISPLPEPSQVYSEKPPTALFIGKDLYRKGGDLLLNAFAIARREVPDARLIFITNEHVPSGLSTEGVELIKATWNRDVIAQIFRRADFLVLPSRLETWGDVLLEAMSFSMPCIGVSGQAMEEVIDDQRTGLIVPPEDEFALANALVFLFKNPEICRQWGECAREQVIHRFTWDRVAERLAIPFESIASKQDLHHKIGVGAP